MGLASETDLLDFDSENGRLGLLLSSKAIVQLLLNPVVGLVTAKIGYHLPLLFGTLILFASAMMFGFGDGYFTLLLARSLQGVASACIGITGMCLVAEKYPTEPDRSKMMGFVLGSVAVGVLIGYPLGGFLYDVFGKWPPFIIVAAFISLFCGQSNQGSIEWLQLFSDNTILLTGGAIGISTTAMAILEPCLPLWLLKEIKPKRWQLGTAFIPDSVGYVVGTNSIGMIAHRVDRFKIATWSMVLVGISAFFIPTATSMTQLVIPHFLLGLGIGAVDAALVPLLAALVDSRQSTHYVSVYAMQQMAVSLAYSLGPVIGGEMVRAIGFPWLMRVIGVVNVLYSPAVIILDGLFAKVLLLAPESISPRS
ncbi:UNVERIFIED_CONTAM: hypothetical protein PYX00_004685 [Menopon gallinae]|uniref:Major facilitator superfamily (MFS) profile domain-containing protein n=1 Tax=Menopon gallinae TaxID=328185 RepID=A0AAW2I6Q1_9NEOP